MSLAGRGILITRPKDLAEPLARLIEARGGRAIVFPVLEIQPLPKPAVLAQLGDFDIAVFVSPSAVRVALPAIGAWPRHVRAAGVGSGTRRELERAGVADVIAPSEGAADSEALLALPSMQEVRGKRVLIVRGEGGRPFLGDSLAARGARVEYAECYRRARPPRDAGALPARWDSEVDAMTAFSAQGVDNLLALLGLDRVARAPLFVPHARVASHALGAGVREVIVAGPGDEQMVERLVAYFHERT